jgi:hypothetical protein
MFSRRRLNIWATATIGRRRQRTAQGVPPRKELPRGADVAEDRPPTGTIKKVRDNLYVIPGAGGNSSVFVTEAGVVLVDTKLPNNAKAILNQRT